MASNLTWSITAYSQTWTGDGLYIQVTTDVACTLYLLWTTIPKRMHLRARTRRGLPKLDDPRYCFVEWNTVNQWTPGDAKHHSFFLGDWKTDEYRWFVFIATIEGIISPSTSPIFLWYLQIGPVAAPVMAPFTLILHAYLTSTGTIQAAPSIAIAGLKSISPATAAFTVQVTALQQPASIVASFTAVIPWLHVEPAIKAQYFTEVTGP